MKKKISGKIIAAIIVALAVVGIAVYLIISISKQVVNIDISGYNDVSITSGGTGKTITPSEEQRTQIRLQPHIPSGNRRNFFPRNQSTAD